MKCLSKCTLYWAGNLETKLAFPWPNLSLKSKTNTYEILIGYLSKQVNYIKCAFAKLRAFSHLFNNDSNCLIFYFEHYFLFPGNIKVWAVFLLLNHKKFLIFTITKYILESLINLLLYIFQNTTSDQRVSVEYLSSLRVSYLHIRSSPVRAHYSCILR